MPQKETPYPKLPFPDWTGENRRLETLSLSGLAKGGLVVGMPLSPKTQEPLVDLANRGVVGLFRVRSPS